MKEEGGASEFTHKPVRNGSGKSPLSDPRMFSRDLKDPVWSLRVILIKDVC